MEITLEALIDEPLVVRDVQGRTWQAVPDISTAEAIWVMDHLAETPGVALYEKCAAIVSRSLRTHHPEMTPERVLDEFNPAHLIQLLRAFLVQGGLLGYFARTGPTPEVPTEATSPASRPRPKKKPAAARR